MHITYLIDYNKIKYKILFNILYNIIFSQLKTSAKEEVQSVWLFKHTIFAFIKALENRNDQHILLLMFKFNWHAHSVPSS